MTSKTTLGPYNANRAAVSDAELLAEMRQHGGRLVARSLDGIETYCYADSVEEIYLLLDEMGFAPHEAVVGSIPSLDEEETGGLYDVWLL